MTKKKILIVEDEKVLLDVLRTKLTKEGFDVHTAENGEEGVRQARVVKPDLILLDIVMPRLDGYEVLEELRRQSPKIPPVIIISNSGQPVEIDRAKQLGALDFIVKAELTPNEVLEKVRSHFDDLLPMSAKHTPESSSTDTPVRAGDIRVLVIEDDQFLRDLLQAKLEREHFQVITAIDGPEGMEHIQHDRPDVILLDIILPGIDGFEILKRMKATPALRHIPVILLSNLGQEADVEKGKAMGAHDYLIKSNFTIDEIIEKIRSTVQK